MPMVPMLLFRSTLQHGHTHHATMGLCIINKLSFAMFFILVPFVAKAIELDLATIMHYVVLVP